MLSLKYCLSILFNVNCILFLPYLLLLYNLLYALFIIVFNTQPLAVTSMLVHLHIPSYLAVHALLLLCNTQSMGSVSYMHPPVLANYLETPLPEFTYSTNKNINILLALTGFIFSMPYVYALHQSSSGANPGNNSTINGTNNSSYS